MRNFVCSATRAGFARQRFAALNYRDTSNLGDEIQTLAAIRFLPRVDAWVDRERLDQFRSWRNHKIILNGWFLHRPEHWPPAESLKPLITSFHLTNEIFPQNESEILPTTTVLAPKGIEYLRRHEPIGARDLHTLQQLREAGVEAYFSGCLTLTLRVDAPVQRGDTVYAVDVSDKVQSYLSQKCDRPIIQLTHHDDSLEGKARFDRGKALLRHYAEAHFVVTSRLHCALPCLALGTPVLFLDTARDAYRLDGLRELLHRTSEADLLGGCAPFDLNAPPPNSTKWHSLRDGLIAACENFVSRMP